MKNLKLSLTLFVFASLLSPALANASKAQALIKQMAVGESIELPASRRVWIQDAKVLKAKTQGSRVQVIGLKEGDSLVKTGEQTWKVTVFSQSNLDKISEIKKYISQTAGLQLETKAGQLIITGHLFEMKEWLGLISAADGATFIMTCQTNSQLKQQIQEFITTKLNNENLLVQRILFNDEWQVRLSQADSRLNQYLPLFNQLGIKVHLESQSIEMKPLINIHITVIELRKDYGRKLGLRWPSQYTASLIPNSEATSESFLSVEALEASGAGRVLASPRLLSRSDSEASFLAGGEVPIKIMNYKHQSIDWKTYGIHLKILPRADSSGRMSLQIETEISSIDESRKVDDIPAFLRNRVSSSFDLLSSQTVVLSGLIRNEQSQHTEGVPGLGRIPILGSLFASKDFQTNQTELVILVRPEIITAETMLKNISNQHLTP